MAATKAKRKTQAELAKTDWAHPWERQEGETVKAYEAFATYRDQGPSRSIAETGRKLGKNRVTLEQWSAKYGWVSRCNAYDDHLDRARRAAAENEMEAMAARQARAAGAAHKLGELGIGHYVERVERYLDYWGRASRNELTPTEKVALAAEHKSPSNLTAKDVAALAEAGRPPMVFPLEPSEAAKIMEVAQKLERQARGEPDALIDARVRSATDPVTRAIVLDQAVQDVGRELLAAAGRVRERELRGLAPADEVIDGTATDA